jgi:hypothetical protein
MAPRLTLGLLVAALGETGGFISNCRPGDEVIVLAPHRGSEIWFEAQIVRVASYDEVHIQFSDRTMQEYRCPRPARLPGDSAGADVHENCIFPNEKVLRQCLCDAHNKPCSEWVTPPVQGSEEKVVVPPKKPRARTANSESSRVFDWSIPFVLLFVCLIATSCAYLALRFRVPPEPPAQVLSSPVAPLGVMWKIIDVKSPQSKETQVRTAKLRAAAIPSPTAFPSYREKPRIAWPARSGPLYKDKPVIRPQRTGRNDVEAIAN